MKRYISRTLKTLALGYIGFPILYFLIVAVVFDVPRRALLNILFSPTYFVLTFLTFFTGWGLWEMKRWSWYVFLITNVGIALGTIRVVSLYSESHYASLAYSLFLLALGAIVMRVRTEIRVPYFFPKIRWWESDPRYKLCAPAHVMVNGILENPHKIDSQILDLSVSGCFLKMRDDLKLDQEITIEFVLFRIMMRCSAVVVWRTQSAVTHPKGVGIKFLAVTKQQKRALKLITMRLKRLAKFYRSSRYLLSQEEFYAKFQEIERQDHGKKPKFRVG